jgi:heme/copper-type cytochrome/quinol oxidase subunit 3
MKIINLISHLLFFTGLLLKFFHIHYNAILILIGLVGTVIALIIGLLKKQEKAVSLLTLTNIVWLVLVFSSVKFLSIETVVLTIAIVLTLISTIVIVRINKIKMIFPILITISIGLIFYFMPTHERYKLLSINWNHEIETDYITWDKYSWFLYQNGEFNKALEASNKARDIAHQLNDNEWVQVIDSHYKKIEQRKWEEYR